MNPFNHKTMKPMAILNSCSRIPLLQLLHCLKSVRPFQLFCLSTSTCNKHFLCPKIFLRVGVLLPYSVPSFQHTHWQMLHEQQQMISIRRNIKNIHTFRSWIHHVRTYIVLRKWREQRPSNKGDLKSSATGEAWSVYCRRVILFLFFFCTEVRAFGVSFKW
jgi:hypothetical protein